MDEMTNEINVTEETTSTDVIPTNDIYEPEYESEEKGGFALMAGVTLAGAAIGAGVVLGRKKLAKKWEEHQIKKLEKKGYSITYTETIEPENSKDTEEVNQSESGKKSK